MREVCHAPHLVDAEVGNILRRRVLRGLLSGSEGESLLGDAAALVDHRHEMTGWLALAAWELRQNLTFYDASTTHCMPPSLRPLPFPCSRATSLWQGRLGFHVQSSSWHDGGGWDLLLFVCKERCYTRL